MAKVKDQKIKVGTVVEANLKFDKSAIDKFQGKFETGGILQKFMDNSVLKGVEPYIPYLNGDLYESGYLHTVPGLGRVTWATPYATVQWDGYQARRNPSGTYSLIGPFINYSNNELGKRGPHWALSWWRDDQKVVVAGLQALANAG